jgi:hypothetical protein
VGRRGAGPKEEEVGRRRIAGQRAEMGGGKGKGFKEVLFFSKPFSFKTLFLNYFQTSNSFQSLNTSNLLQVFKLF